MGTAAQESDCGGAIAQYGGPALGVWQMEPATESSVYSMFALKPVPMASVIKAVMLSGIPRPEQLVGNLYYSCLMARLLYFSIPSPLPAAGDLEGQWLYYKAHYNSELGAATRDQYMAAWTRIRAKLK